MKLTDALLGEHGVLVDMLGELDGLTSRAESAHEVAVAVEVPAAALLQHAKVEDELLFPALEAVAGKQGITTAMRAEHVEIDALVARVRSASSLEECLRALDELLEKTREHFEKEEQILFPMIEREIGDTRLEALAEKWAALRRVTIAR